MAAMESSGNAASHKPGLVTRAIAILEVVVAHDTGIGVREAARLTRVDRSAVSRILSQYEELGYVEQLSERGMYTAGPRLFALTATLSERDSIARAARPTLTRLVRQFNETAYVVERVDDTVVYRARVDSAESIRSVIDIGTVRPLLEDVAGLAVVSGLSVPEQELSLATESATRRESATLIEPDTTRLSVADGTRLGYVSIAGRGDQNRSDVASPFFSAAGHCLGAIVVSGPTERMQSHPIDALGTAVRAAAQSMTERLGGARTT